MFRLKMLMLLNQAGDNGGGGGGATGGQQGQQGQQGGDGGGLTQAQRDEITRIANGANSTHHTRIQKTLETTLPTMIQAELGKLLDEKLSALGISPAVGGDDGKGKGKKGEVQGAGGGGENQELLARIKELEKREAEKDRLLTEERQAAQQSEDRARLQAALSDAGVSPGHMKGAIALLYVDEKRVARSKDGQTVFKMQREGYTDELDLRKGIEEWLNTTEGKHYLSPKGASGSGTETGRSGQQQSRNGQPKTVQEKKMDLLRSFMNAERGGG